MFHFRVALFSLTLAISICGIFLKKWNEWIYSPTCSPHSHSQLTCLSLTLTLSAHSLTFIFRPVAECLPLHTHTQWHTHTDTHSQLLRYKPKIVNSPVRSVIVYCILRCSRYFALLLRSLCAFLFFLLLPGLSTQPTGRRVCTWNILTM